MPTPRSMVWRGLPLLSLGALLGLAQGLRLAIGPLPPLLAAMPVLCPLRALTGIACPTCGLGRSLIYSLALQPQTAIAYHPLGPVLLLGGAVGALAFCVRPHALIGALQRMAGATRRHPVGCAVALIAYTVWGFARHI